MSQTIHPNTCSFYFPNINGRSLRFAVEDLLLALPLADFNVDVRETPIGTVHVRILQYSVETRWTTILDRAFANVEDAINAIRPLILLATAIKKVTR